MTRDDTSMTQALYRYSNVMVAIRALMIDIAGRESRAEGIQLALDLSHAKFSSSGSLADDCSYGVTIGGLDRLRRRIAVECRGARHVPGEEIGPFKTPSNKEETIGAASPQLASIADFTQSMK